MNSLEPHHRCRNLGGHDMASCSKKNLPTSQWDYACHDKMPYVKYCHIAAMNGDSNETHFEFTPYNHFTAETARKTCEKMGAKLPGVRKEYDALWLLRAVEYLSSHVRFAWPFSLRWTSWPVSTSIWTKTNNLVWYNKIYLYEIVMYHISYTYIF